MFGTSFSKENEYYLSDTALMKVITELFILLKLLVILDERHLLRLS